MWADAIPFGLKFVGCNFLISANTGAGTPAGGAEVARILERARSAPGDGQDGRRHLCHERAVARATQGESAGVEGRGSDSARGRRRADAEGVGDRSPHGSYGAQSGVVERSQGSTRADFRKRTFRDGGIGEERSADAVGLRKAGHQGHGHGAVRSIAIWILRAAGNGGSPDLVWRMFRHAWGNPRLGPLDRRFVL